MTELNIGVTDAYWPGYYIGVENIQPLNGLFKITFNDGTEGEYSKSEFINIQLVPEKAIKVNGESLRIGETVCANWATWSSPLFPIKIGEFWADENGDLYIRDYGKPGTFDNFHIYPVNNIVKKGSCTAGLSAPIPDLSVKAGNDRPLPNHLQKVLGREYKIYGVPGDGNCLIHSFLALTDPKYLDLTRSQKIVASKQYRKKLAQWVRKNYTNQKKELEAEGLTISKGGIDLEEPVSFEVYLDWLENTDEYMGQWEIRWLQEMTGYNIILFEVHFDVIYCGNREMQPENNLFIAWLTTSRGQGAHYDPIMQFQSPKSDEIVNTVFNFTDPQYRDIEQRLQNYIDYCCITFGNDAQMCQTWPRPNRKEYYRIVGELIVEQIPIYQEIAALEQREPVDYQRIAKLQADLKRSLEKINTLWEKLEK